MGDRFAMARTLPPDLARGMLAAAQRLAGAPRSGVVETVRAVGALQAQDARAAELGIRARRPGSTLAEVRAARFEDRSVARTWVMRGTLHLIPAEDARWMVELLGPVGLRKSARRIAELGEAHGGAGGGGRAGAGTGGPGARPSDAAGAGGRGPGARCAAAGSPAGPGL